MKDRIQAQIDRIDEMLAWVEQYRKEDFSQKSLLLCEQRRRLRVLQRACENNPGIAAFGKSQVGKSYMISCLLQGQDGKDFMVKAPGGQHSFVYDINPPSDEGGGKESTGVVSRFSSMRRCPEEYCPQLPVMVRTFSLGDVVLILSDSYYNDFANYTSMSEAEASEMCDRLQADYGTRPRQSSPVITTDEVLGMKAYFAAHINNAQTFNKSAFFDRLALVIERVPTEDYAAIFASLWHADPHFTRLFNSLRETLAQFGYARQVYLPIDSVLHEGVKENTIMSVQCLKQLFVKDSPHATDVYVRQDEHAAPQKCASAMPKAQVCALTSEVVFKIEDSFLRSSGHYCMEGIAPEVQAKLPHGEVKMEMLRENDLLDFPGARSREQEDVAKTCEDSVLLGCFLRGKVAYLFNRFNEEKGINILLYCHHNKDNDVTGLYKMLQDWVRNYVGNTPEQRARKLERTGISPLFYIGTMFNLDMTLNVGAAATPQAVDQRWLGRFDTVMNKQCFHRDTVEWLRNWTRPGEDFKNSYVLRDYKYSGPKAGLYAGFDECGEERQMLMSEDYYRTMRDTFVANPYTRALFSDPALSWDVAASLRNDGSLYIIQNLSLVASRMDKAREQDFADALDAATKQCFKIMRPYYVQTNADALLREGARKARSIFREMDFACNADNYFFGHLLVALQITEPAVYRLVHATVQGPELNAQVNSWRDYELLAEGCRKSGCPLPQSAEEGGGLPEALRAEALRCIGETYGFDTEQETADYLEAKGIDLARLLGRRYKRKANSYVLADKVYEHWERGVRSVELVSQMAGEATGFDPLVMTSLTENVTAAARAVKLPDLLAQRIESYVNVTDIHTANEGLLSDILSSTINDFVCDLGYSRLSAEQADKARRLCQEQKLPVRLAPPSGTLPVRPAPAALQEEQLTRMFREMSVSPQPLAPSFADHYQCWMEYLFLSFMAHVQVPADFQADANLALGELLGLKDEGEWPAR